MFLPWVGLEDHLSNYPAWWLLAHCNGCLNLPDELRIVRRPRISSTVATSQRTFLGIFLVALLSLLDKRLATFGNYIHHYIPPFLLGNVTPNTSIGHPEIHSPAFFPTRNVHQFTVFCWLPLLARVPSYHDSHQVFLDICRQMRKKSLAKEHQKSHPLRWYCWWAKSYIWIDDILI